MLASRMPQTTSDWIIFGAIVAVVIFISALQALHHRRRRASLAAAARELGLQDVDVKSSDAGYIHHPVKGQRGHKLRLCAVGFVADRAARLSEFTFQTGSGKYTRTNYNLQLSLECPESWPAIHLSDKPDFMNRPISQLFRSARPVTDDAVFEKRWQVRGAGATRAAATLTPELRALLLQGEKTEFWSIQDGWLTCTRRRACKPKDIRGLIDRAVQVRDAMASTLGE